MRHFGTQFNNQVELVLPLRPIATLLLVLLIAISDHYDVVESLAPRSSPEHRHHHRNRRANSAGTFDAEPLLTFQASYGNTTEVSRLLQLPLVDVNARDWLFQTPLHLAAKFGRIDVVKLLVKHGAVVNARNKDYEETPLHLAAKIGHLDMINFLLDHGADVESPTSKTVSPGGSPLLYATSYANSLDAVELLISRGARVNAVNSYPQSALHHAIEHQNIHLANVLLNKYNITKDFKDEFGNTALNWLVKLYAEPQAALVQLLVKSGVDIEAPDNYGRSPLHNAAIYGHLEVVIILLESGANVDQVDIYGSRPLHSVITIGTGPIGRIVRTLLRHGAIVSATDRDGCNAPLHALVRSPQRRVNNSLAVAIAKQLLLFGADPTLVDPCTRQAPVTIVSKTLQWDMINLMQPRANATMLESNTTSDAYYADKLTGRLLVPELISAASVGDLVRVMLQLVRYKVRVNTQDYRNQTALHMAALHGHLNVATVLLRNNASVSAVDSAGKTPLHNAASAGHPAMINLLVNHGANVTAVANNGAAPIHFVIDFRNSSNAMETLMQHGASVSQNLMPDMMSPFHMAVVNQNYEYMETLLANGADMEARNVNGATALNHLLMSNCCYPQLPIVGFLLDRGANIEADNNYGMTPLHMAIVSKKRYQVIEYLLYRGADANALDANGCNSPLILLINTALVGKPTVGADEIARLLIRYNADYTQVDACLRLTALDLAYAKNLVAVIQVLKDAAAMPRTAVSKATASTAAQPS